MIHEGKLIKEHLDSSPQWTQRKLAKAIGISVGTLNVHLQKQKLLKHRGAIISVLGLDEDFFSKSDDQEVYYLKKELALKDKEIELLKREVELEKGHLNQGLIQEAKSRGLGFDKKDTIEGFCKVLTYGIKGFQQVKTANSVPKYQALLYHTMSLLYKQIKEHDESGVCAVDESQVQLLKVA